MKNLVKMILFGAALAVPSVAFATECTLGERAAIAATPRSLGFTSPTTAAEIVGIIYPNDAYQGVRAACSQEQVLAAFVRINGSAPIALEQSFKIPVIIQPVVESTATEVRAQPAPVASATGVGPGSVIDRQIADLNQRVAALEAGGGDPTEIAALRSEMASLRAQQARSTSPELQRLTNGRQEIVDRMDRLERAMAQRGENAPRSSSEANLLASLAAQKTYFDERIATIERMDRAQNRHLGAVDQYLDAHDRHLARHDQEIDDANQNASAALAAAEASEAGWWTPKWWWLIPLLLIAALIAWLISARATGGLAQASDLHTKADKSEVDALKTTVDALETRLTDTEHQVGKKIVALPLDLEFKAVKAKEGEEFTTAVVVDGEAYEVQLRKGAGSDVFIVSGVEGHTVSNAVKVVNLTRTLRNAAWSDRLNVKVQFTPSS